MTSISMCHPRLSIPFPVFVSTFSAASHRQTPWQLPDESVPLGLLTKSAEYLAQMSEFARLHDSGRLVPLTDSASSGRCLKP